MQSLANQLQWCMNSKNYLNDLNSDLRRVSDKYDNAVDELRSRAYMDEMLPQIAQMNKEFEEGIKNLIFHIDSEHVSYVNTQSQAIRGALDGIMGL